MLTIEDLIAALGAALVIGAAVFGGNWAYDKFVRQQYMICGTMPNGQVSFCVEGGDKINKLIEDSINGARIHQP